MIKNTKGQSKLMKSLRENEIEESKLFNENVLVKENFFFCTICTKFSSITKLRAKSHILSCGKTKKKSIPKKIIRCLECEESFASKKELEIHHRKEHICQTYTCSSCLKTFNRRQSYMRHLQSHQQSPKLKCPVVLCEKFFRYNCDLSRHIKTHNKPPVMTIERRSSVEELVDYAVDLEERRIVVQ